MISHPSYTVESWVLRETALDLGMLAQSESVFALSNGHIGWRGNLEEAEPHGLPCTYLNGVHELHALPYVDRPSATGSASARASCRTETTI